MQHYLVRFAGGSGGDTMASILNASIDRDYSFRHDAYNSTRYNDLFSCDLTDATVSNYTQDALSLPGLEWHRLTGDQIRSVVEYWKGKSPHIPIGKCHYLLPMGLDYRAAFRGFNVIDIRPRMEDRWIFTALQIFKSAIRKSTRPYSKYIGAGREGIGMLFDEHFASHGWWPEWWAWYHPMTLAEFIEYTMLDHQKPKHFPPVLDVCIDSRTFTLDESLSWIDDIRRSIGIHIHAQPQMDCLAEWTRKNNEIVDYLNLRPHLGKDYDWRTKQELLIAVFTDRYEEILNKQ